MKQTMALAALALLVAVAASTSADDDQSTQGKANKKTDRQTKPLLTTADTLPDGMARFNGVLVGRLAKKDVEKGTFIILVDAVPRVWRNSKAEDPKGILGKYVEVDGVTGKWLDVLLLVKKGETLECEARHDGGRRLTFPGELLRKVAPVKPGDYPVLPEQFRGFHGVAKGRIVEKDAEMLELILQIDEIKSSGKKSRAKNPQSVVGKKVMLAGFWRRKDAYHSLKVGDAIEVGIQHVQTRSDHLTVAEQIRKLGDSKTKKEPSPESRSSKDGFPNGMRGFRGIMIGRLVSKDVEKGEFAFRAEKVTRVWKRNKAADTGTCKGREFKVEGVSGKFLDVLLTLKTGDRLQVEAFHNSGESLDFPGELLKKID